MGSDCDDRTRCKNACGCAVVACERVRVRLQAYVGLCSYAFMHAFVQLSNSYMAAMEYKVA